MIKVVSHRQSVLTSTQIAGYRRVCVGRASDFALQQPDGRYRRAGRLLTDEVLCLHLQGTHTIGTYLINEQGRCRCCVFDADRADGLRVLQGLQARLAHDGVASCLEASRRGGHLWVFFAELLPASQVRDWFVPCCPAGVEFYPKQDEGGGYGSLIRMPLGVHRLTGKRYPFMVSSDGTQEVAPVAHTIEEQLAWLETVERIAVPPHRLHPLPARSHHPTTQAHTQQSLALPSIPLRHLPSAPNSIHAWCTLQDPFTIIGRWVELDRHGLGCCPFGEHHGDGHDRHPSFRVYAPRRVGGSCWYCYTWGQGGNVFDFLCRWYQLDAVTMWRRIQADE